MPVGAKKMFENLKVVLLAGGVGGAKMADGLAQVMPAANLTVVVNTGDDFQHLGLTVCPDLDTVLYTLAGVANPETGWGRRDESWLTMDEVARLGGPDWFRLGDLDLATNLLRTNWLDEGLSLTAVTRRLSQQFDVAVDVLPMSNQPAPTVIETDEGPLPFQVWFVRERWQPPVRHVRLPEDVRATVPVMAALENADIILIAPSNPFVSIEPILNVYPIRAMILDLPQAVVAVTPIIGGRAVKGPVAKMMQDRGLPVTPAAVAAYYGDLIDGFVYHETDDAAFDDLPTGQTIATRGLDAWLTTPADRRRLALEVLNFALELA